jgi:DNA repair exonuclease SbcCD ATPase subunit
MIIRRLTLENWGPFQGEQTLELDAKAYGIAAPNWSGKSFLVEAITFALFGKHRHRTEDAWIHGDEMRGSVVLETDAGLVITRSRVRGKATRLTASIESTAKGMMTGKEAQDLIVKSIGLTDEDLFATCVISQKSTDKMVTLDPGERMRIVGGWLRLESLQDCEADARDKLSRLIEVITTYEAIAAKEREREAEARDKLDIPSDLERRKVDAEIEKRRADLASELERVKEAHRNSSCGPQSTEDLKAWRASWQALQDWKRAVAEGKELATEEPDIGLLEAKADEAKAAWVDSLKLKTQAESALTAGDAVAVGAFDGTCPVAGISCPAKDTINADRVKARTRLAKLQKAYDKACETAKEVGTKHARAVSKLTEGRDVVRELERLRKLAGELHKASKLARTKGEPPAEQSSEDIAKRIADASVAISKVESKIHNLNDGKEAIQRHRLAAVAAEKHIETLRAEVETHRKALSIFGRNGAQRRIAEPALAEMESEQNLQLAEAGVDLRVNVSWSREGRGLADHCDECGAAYPASAKVKVCERCGAPRGPKQIDRLELEPSDRSGAAEDIAGLSFQLSAAAWLRRVRSFPWSVAIVDEPFAACDKANQTALAVHMQRMLSAYGMLQSFVIAHNPATTEALPGRIVIEREGKASTVRVAL